MVYPVWPTSLTDADWQKKKGAVAKIAGETGIGGAMKAAKALFDKIDFNSAEASQIPPSDRGEEDLLEKKAALQQWYAKTVEPARDKVKDIKDLATKTAAAWKKNKLIPSSSVKAVDAVATDADQFWIVLKSNSQTMVDISAGYDRLIAIAKKTEESERAKIDSSIKNLKTALQAVVSNPTKSEWEDTNTSAHQRCRSMCNAIKGIPSLKKQYWAEWQPYGNFYAKTVEAGSPTEKAEILKIVKTVGGSLKSFESTYKAHL